MADSDRAESPAGEVATQNNETQEENHVQNGEVGQQQEGEQPQQRFQWWSMVKTLLIRMVFIYMVSSFFRRGQTPATNGPDGKPVPAAQTTANMYHKGISMDMYVYITEQEIFTDFKNDKALFWLEEDIVYGDWTSGIDGDGSYYKKGEIVLSENVKNNGSLYIHTFFVKAGNSPDPTEKERYSRKTTVHKVKQMNKYKKRKFHTTVNLLTGTTDAHPDLVRASNETKVEILSMWHPNLTLNMIDDHTPWVRGSVPAPLDEFIDFVPGTNHYYPILYYNEYWNLNSEYMPINDTTPVVNLSLTYQPISLFKWQMYAAQGMRNRWYSFMGDDMMEESDEDQDSLKQTFLETNPYLLGLTIAVSIVHSVFEFLAFKNDIQFWKNRKSLEGLSVRSVFYSVFQSLVVVLYVMDNETNFVIRCSVCVGLAIELWKITKVVNITVDREAKLLGVIPRVRFTDKSTYTESDTRKYDMMAFKYLSWALFPLLIGYSIYSLLYNEHKGWYSFILNMVYGFLLTFGFIMMTPQLFINYKLKSVAHLPWRMLTYKALNTFIDDLFAFVIKMPTLYRLGCFRDDIVFIIFLYQRYIYRVDPKRVNEFGVSQEMMDENGEILPEVEGESSEPQAENKTLPLEDGASGDNTKANKTNKQGKPKSKKQKKID